MRQLCAALALVLVTLVAGEPRGEPVDDVRGSAGVATYFDELDTVIWSPHAGVGATVPGGVELDVAWSADVISSASVDVVTAATVSMEETRNELSAAVQREAALLDIDVGGSYVYSFENDADSHTVQLQLTRGFAQDNWTVGLRYGLSHNRLGVRDEPRSDWQPMTAYSGDLTLTRLLGVRTVGELGYSLYALDGFQESPYRRVPIVLGADLRGAMWVEERVPDRRLRHAVTARARRALGERWVVAAQYRLYLDDWGITAHTARLDQVVDLGSGFAARLRQRVSLQGGADFYMPIYDQETEYRTRDRRLSAHNSALVGAAMMWKFARLGSLGTAEAFVAGRLLAWQFDEFTAPSLTITSDAALEPLGTVLGGVVQLGVEVRP